MSRLKSFVNLKFSQAPYTLVHLQKVLSRNLTKDCLLTKVSQKEADPTGKKITIVGAGNVGAATAFAIIAQNVSEEVCLLDIDEKKATAEMLDISQGSIYLNNPKVTSSFNYADTARSSICIVTAGVRQKQGETRLDLVQRNADLFKNIIPNLMKHSPNSLLLIVSNPVDVLTYVSWKLSGLPVSRVVGSGTSLDSARFKQFISKRLGVAPSSVHAYVIGEHGDSSVPVWSSANVAGVRLVDLTPKIGSKEDEEKWENLHKAVRKAAYEIISRKGYTSWAIALCASAIAKAVLQNSNEMIPVTTSACGFHGIEKDVFLSLPCVVNSNGVQAVINQNLTAEELQLLHKSAKILSDAQDKVQF